MPYFIWEGLSIGRRYHRQSAQSRDMAIWFDVSFSAHVDKTLEGYTTLREVYDDQIKPAVLDILNDAVVTTQTSPGPSMPGDVYLVDDLPRFDTAGNKISGQMVVLASGESSLMSLSIVYDVGFSEGETFRKLLDGRRYSYAIYTDGGTLTLRETVTTQSIAHADDFAQDYRTPYGVPPAKFIDDAAAEGPIEWRFQSINLKHEKNFQASFQDTEVEIYERAHVRDWRATRDTQPVQLPYITG